MLKNELQKILAQRQGEEGETWLEYLQLRHENGTLRVGFPHAYYARWFAAHKQTLFEEALRRRFAAALPHIVYEPLSTAVVRAGGGGFLKGRNHADRAEQKPAEADKYAFHASQYANREAGQSPDRNADRPVSRNRSGNKPPGEAQRDGQDFFTGFISNAKNAFPLATARQIAQSTAGDGYKPFLLCGRSGTGKTHLLQAMAATLARAKDAGRVICAGAARFCTDNPAWARRPELFWQQCDALLLDDIQDMAGQAAWQRKLIDCIDACPGRGRGFQAHADSGPRFGAAVMVFACSGPPQALKTLDERLRSRLESGLVVELMEPDLDVRLRYLQAICKERSLALTRAQLLFLAQRCAQFRLLQGLLLKVEAFHALQQRPLTQADMENIVRTGVADKTPGCREILDEVSRNFGLRPDDVLGEKRRPDLVLARQVAMYVCRQRLGLSYPELGRAFGGRDHSTVIHAIKKINKLLVSDKRVQKMVTELERKTP